MSVWPGVVAAPGQTGIADGVIGDKPGDAEGPLHHALARAVPLPRFAGRMKSATLYILHIVWR